MSDKTTLDQLREEILRLKTERQAVILGHNYQLGEVQDIADFVGDSLELSRRAAATEAKVIVFCGVNFMAETAKILSPEKIVLLPDLGAGCPLANMATAAQVRARKAEFPGRPVVSYVNTTAEVKAESDICCTSSNAVKIVESLPEKELIFLPDRNLGSWVAEQTGKKLILWDGFCTTHQRILPEHVLALKEKHPEAKVLVHPECTPQVRKLADVVASTSGILRQARESIEKTFIIGTECGIIHTLKKQNPEKNFFIASPVAVCPNMKKINLEKILWSLQEMKYQIELPEAIRLKAKTAIERMLAIG